jgi:hypothetical protein
MFNQQQQQQGQRGNGGYGGFGNSSRKPHGTLNQHDVSSSIQTSLMNTVLSVLPSPTSPKTNPTILPFFFFLYHHPSK